MSMWERKEHEADSVPHVSTPPDWDAGNLDDESWSDEDAYPELREYRDVLIHSSAYAWLASALTAQLSTKPWVKTVEPKFTRASSTCWTLRI